MLVSCYVAPNPSSSTKCQSIKIGSDLWQLIKTSVWQEKCFMFSQAHFTSHNMSHFWSPIHYTYKIFLTSDAKSETNWNQINQINRLTYFCLTQHEASLYRTPNYLMENQKQSKSIQYCSNLLYTFHGKKVFDDGDLHICTLLQQQHYCFTTRIHLKKKLMFDSLRRFIDSWSNFVSFSLGLNLLFERKSISKHILNTG